ncbi:MAG: hypothetical protein Q8P82_01120 [bacterium]|nr:hypothetical protein [bacterium]
MKIGGILNAELPERLVLFLPVAAHDTDTFDFARVYLVGASSQNQLRRRAVSQNNKRPNFF